MELIVNMSMTIAFPWTFRKRTPPVSPAKKVSAAAKSRKKLRDTNPKGCAEYLKKDAQRKQNKYIPASRLPEDKLVERRRKDAEAKRNKRKITNQGNKKPSGNKRQSGKRYKDLTDEEKKEYMKMKKRESRKQRSQQKKSSDQKKDREVRADARKEESKRRSKQMQGTPMQARDPSIKSPPSRSTIYRRSREAAKHMPKSPRTYVSVIENLVEKASPNKKTELERRSLKRKLADEFVCDSLRETVGELKKHMTEEKRKQYHVIVNACQLQRKYGVKGKLAASLGIGGKVKRKLKKREAGVLGSISRKRRRDATNPETVSQVESFWISEGVSHVVPLKKRVKKGRPLYVLDCSYIQAYRNFRAAHPQTTIGYVRFLQLKPTFVRHMKAVERIVCCCIKCENMKLLLRALNM